MLLLLLIGLFFAECLWLVPWNSVIVEQAWPGGRWWFRREGRGFRLGTRLLIPLTPSPTGIAAQMGPLPLSMSPDGFVLAGPEAWSPNGPPMRAHEFHRWGDIASIRADEASVMLNDQQVGRLDSPFLASTVADTLSSVLNADPKRRDKAILQGIREALDPVSARQRIALAEEVVAPARHSGLAVWLALFAAAPATVLLAGTTIGLAIGATLTFGAVVITGIAFFRGHRTLCAGHRWHRLESIVAMTLFWPMATRASTSLMRHALVGIHPVALAVARQDTDEDAGLVARIRRDLMYPLSLDEFDDEARRCVAWYVEALRSSLDDVVARERPEWAETTPERAAPQGMRECPRCGEHYHENVLECTDCPGVRLL